MRKAILVCLYATQISAGTIYNPKQLSLLEGMIHSANQNSTDKTPPKVAIHRVFSANDPDVIKCREAMKDRDESAMMEHFAQACANLGIHANFFKSLHRKPQSKTAEISHDHSYLERFFDYYSMDKSAIQRILLQKENEYVESYHAAMNSQDPKAAVEYFIQACVYFEILGFKELSLSLGLTCRYHGEIHPHLWLKIMSGPTESSETTPEAVDTHNQKVQPTTPPSMSYLREMAIQMLLWNYYTLYKQLSVSMALIEGKRIGKKSGSGTSVQQVSVIQSALEKLLIINSGIVITGLEIRKAGQMGETEQIQLTAQEVLKSYEALLKQLTKLKAPSTMMYYVLILFGLLMAIAIRLRREDEEELAIFRETACGTSL